MNAKGKRMYTGRVEVHDGWELRPYAYKTADGVFVPELAARKHRPGSAIDIVTMDMTCGSKDDAFSAALTCGLRLVKSAA